MAINQDNVADKLIPTTGTLTVSGVLATTTGTTTVAPVTFTAGTNLTSPVQGAEEFDGASLYITGNTTTGSGRQIINASQVAQLASSALWHLAVNSLRLLSDQSYCQDICTNLSTVCYLQKRLLERLQYHFLTQQRPISLFLTQI